MASESGHETFHGLRSPGAEDAANASRINGEDVRGRDSSSIQPGYVHVDQFNEDFLDRFYPDDPGGNLYKKNRPDLGWTNEPDGDGRGYQNDGWAKRNNGAAWDWSDLNALLTVMADPEDGDDYLARVEEVGDVDQWLRWLAVNNILANAETNISNGVDDDYTIYSGEVDTRFRFLPHDLDSTPRPEPEQLHHEPAKHAAGSRGEREHVSQPTAAFRFARGEETLFRDRPRARTDVIFERALRSAHGEPRAGMGQRFGLRSDGHVHG